MKKSHEIVIENIKAFLKTQKKVTMERCYSSIIDKKGLRYFDNSIEIIDNEKFDNYFPFVSNVVITANRIECDSLNYIAATQDNSQIWKRHNSLYIIPGYNVGIADAYIFKVNSAFFLHINAFETGSNTPGGSTDIVRFISNNPFLNPNTIISFGICYGRDATKQEIGDVIIPQKLYPWSIGQKISEKKFSIKDDNFNLWLFNAFEEKEIYSALWNFCKGFDGTAVSDSLVLKNGNKKTTNSFCVNTIMGNLSTGEAVVSSSRAKKIIQNANRNDKELGGEMEGYGLAKECIYYAQIPCIIVKAICDWGELKDIESVLENEKIKHPDSLKDKLQAYAAFCSGIVLFKLLLKEKELFLSLKLSRFVLDNKYGKNFLNGNTAFTKETIIKRYKRFYSNNYEVTEKVFCNLVEKGIIIHSTNNPNEYRIDDILLRKVTNHGYY